MRSLCIFIIISFLLVSPATAKHLHKETEYQKAWCKGETEVRLPNGSRADCVTSNYAVEIDFAPKWHEAIGQALDYAGQTGKSPAVLLIIEKPKDWRYYRKAFKITRKEGIKLWYITPKALR